MKKNDFYCTLRGAFFLSSLHCINDSRVLDPACGSGNFLIIFYKELRRIEIEILKKIDLLQKKGQNQGAWFYESSVSLNNFYGIEIDDFAHEVARLSLWIAEHQMNVEMEKALFNFKASLLPLRDAGQIFVGNSLRVDLADLLNKKSYEELYIIGNPPYIGSRLQNSNQKKDLEFAVTAQYKWTQMDYIAGWFFKVKDFLRDYNCRASFVATNSIFQGEQVSYIWKPLSQEIDIIFAYKNIKWNNNASKNAGVSVSIVGLAGCNEYKRKKFIFDIEGHREEVNYISAYLSANNRIIVDSTRKSILGLPPLDNGNQPIKFGIITL